MIRNEPTVEASLRDFQSQTIMGEEFGQILVEKIGGDTRKRSCRHDHARPIIHCDCDLSIPALPRLRGHFVWIPKND